MLQGLFHGGDGDQLQPALLSVHRQGERLAAQRAAHHRQHGHAVGKGEGHIGAVRVQRSVVDRQVGQLRIGFAQKAAAVQSGVGFQLVLAEHPVIDADAVILGLGLVAAAAQTSAQDELLGGGKGVFLGPKGADLYAVGIPAALPQLSRIFEGNGAGTAQRSFKRGLKAGIAAVFQLHHFSARAGGNAEGVAGLFHRHDGGKGAVIAVVAVRVHEVLHREAVAVDDLIERLGQIDLAPVQLQVVFAKGVGAFSLQLVLPVDLDHLAAGCLAGPGPGLGVHALQAVQPEDQTVGHICLGDGFHITTERHGLFAVEPGVSQINLQKAGAVYHQGILSAHGEPGACRSHGRRGKHRQQKRSGTDQSQRTPKSFFHTFATFFSHVDQSPTKLLQFYSTKNVVKSSTGPV